jgi:hypothetical protein
VLKGFKVLLPLGTTVTGDASISMDALAGFQQRQSTSQTISGVFTSQDGDIRQLVEVEC